MYIFILSRDLKDTDDKLIAISVRGGIYNIYYQEFLICPPDKIRENCNALFEKTIKYINETLIKEKRFFIKRLDVIGDINALPYREYFLERKSGCFFNLTKDIRKGTALNESCSRIYEYIDKLKGINFNISDWGVNNQGYMWSDHKYIRRELGKLAGDKYYDEDKVVKEFLELL